jgi:hypothetical protein
MAWVGTLRYAQHRRLPAIHQHWCHRGMAVAPRTGTPLRERSDARLTLARPAPARLQPQAYGAPVRLGSVSKVEMDCDCCHTGPRLRSLHEEGMAHDFHRSPMPLLSE